MGIVAILASLLILFYFILSAVWFSRVRGKKFDQLCEEDKRRIYKLMNKGNYKKQRTLCEKNQNRVYSMLRCFRFRVDYMDSYICPFARLKHSRPFRKSERGGC